MRFWYLPTLLWLDASDSMLHFLCWGGVVLAAAVMIGLMPGPLVLSPLAVLSVAHGGWAGVPGIPVGFSLARGRVAGDPSCSLEQLAEMRPATSPGRSRSGWCAGLSFG